jgi:GNAT superfamily N-acetyltransferase
MAITVRAAAASDESRCMRLIETLTGVAATPLWRATYAQLLRGERGAVLIAEDAGTILGVVTFSYNLAIRYGGEYCQLEELIVDSAERGRNVGGLLVAAAVNAARRRGCAEMGLYLLESTEGNSPFYAKYGFLGVGSEMRQTLRPGDARNTGVPSP